MLTKIDDAHEATIKLTNKTISHLKLQLFFYFFALAEFGTSGRVQLHMPSGVDRTYLWR